MSKSKKVLKEIETDEPKVTVNFKATEVEKDDIQKKADEYCQGNRSLWIRYASLNYTPKASELKKV